MLCLEGSFSMAYTAFLLICGIWGANFLLMKKASLCLSPAAIGTGRLVIGAIIVGAYWFWQTPRFSVKWGQLGPLMFVVLFGFVWPFALQPYLIARHGGAFIGMTVAFVPLLTILVSIPLLGVWPTRRQVWGVLAALGCLTALMLDGVRREVPTIDLALAATVPMFYAVANTVIRRWLREVPAVELTAWFLSVSAFCSVPLLIPLGVVRSDSRPEDWSLAIGALLVLAVLGTGISQVLFNWLIHHQGPLFAGMVTNLVPVGAVLWGWADAEQISPLQLLSLLGVVAAVAWVQYGAARAPSGFVAPASKS